MTDTVSSDSAEQTLKNQGAQEGTLDVKGDAVGLGIKYDVPRGVPLPVHGEYISVPTKLDKKSLENAEKKVGLRPDEKNQAPNNNKKAAPIIAATENSAKPTTTPSISPKTGKSSKALAASATKGSSGALSSQRHNYNALKVGSPKAKHKMRRLLKLRQTFDKIAKRPERKFTVKFENLALEDQIKLIESALEKKLDRIATGEPVMDAIKRLGGQGTPRLAMAMKKTRKASMSKVAESFKRFDDLGMLLGGFVRGPSIYD